MGETTKRSKAIKSAPWIGIVTALFASWIDSRSNATDTAQAAAQAAAAIAQRQATISAGKTSDERADRAWKILKFILEKQDQSIEDCHERMDELEGAHDGILGALNERSGPERRERLDELREPHGERMSKRRPAPTASRIPDDYNAVQAIDPGDPLNGGDF